MLHPQQSSPYSLSINGGLPLSSGVRSYWSRSALLHTSAILMLLSVLSLLLGDSPDRPSRGAEETDWDKMTERQKARAHWNMVVYDKSKDIADWLGIPPPPGYMTPEQRHVKYREMHMKKHPEHAKQQQQERRRRRRRRKTRERKERRSCRSPSCRWTQWTATAASSAPMRAELHCHHTVDRPASL